MRSAPTASSRGSVPSWPSSRETSPSPKPAIWSAPDTARLSSPGFISGRTAGLPAVRRRFARGPSPLAGLVEALAAVSGLERLRLSSLEPGDVDESLLDVLSRHANCVPHLHLPLQSGSPGVLQRMNRQYTREGLRRSDPTGPLRFGPPRDYHGYHRSVFRTKPRRISSYRSTLPGKRGSSRSMRSPSVPEPVPPPPAGRIGSFRPKWSAAECCGWAKSSGIAPWHSAGMPSEPQRASSWRLLRTEATPAGRTPVGTAEDGPPAISRFRSRARPRSRQARSSPYA